ncbi:MAG: PASTA domain-containing protein [Bacteroidales bacterium]|jgi:beta-lactam-binding protein with PASTA domain|nr:PASTA domain-containing protein [Bacteroidales bacterium]
MNNFYRKHKLLATLIIMLSISLLVVFLIGISLKAVTKHGQEYLLPDFTGMDSEQLHRFVRDSNLYEFEIVIVDSVFVPDKKGGTVLTQDPVAGSKVKKGRKVYLSVVAMSMPKIEMPNLVDLSLRQAENMLQTNDLQLGQVIYKASKYPNAVLEQRYKGRIIEPGVMIPYQSKITLIVGKEPLFGEETEETEETEILE